VKCSTDYESDVDEFIVAGLNPLPSEKIIPPRLSESKISFECRLNQIVNIGNGKAGSGFIVIGTIILFHIDDSVIVDGKIDVEKLNPIGRLAGNWYTRPTDNFKIQRTIKPDK
jgi:flavin reductase (DIM6/NTAB) family NADH-FMN oxidoreductase RutF